MKYFKILITPPPFSLEHGHCPAAEPRSKESSFLSVLKCALACFALVFFVLAGNAHAQQTATCPHTPSDPPTDKDALIALYCATDGDNWSDNSGWLSNQSLGNWHGVAVDTNGRVSSLTLNSNGLSGSIPAELGNLSNLQRLSLSQNQLTGTIPTELGNLSSLQQLVLWNNNLSGEIPTELGNLTSLQQLVLWNNNLSGEIPTELGNLSNLEELALWGNRLTGEIPTELGNLSNLEELVLWGNRLTGEIPTELGNLTSLERLNLNDNMLSGEIPTELGNLSNLEELVLYNNQLSGEIPSSLGSLTSLERLYLNDNMLSGEIPTELGNLSNLEGLLLHNNQLSGEIPSSLGSLTSLQSLYLWNNNLSGEIPSSLGNLTSLEQLYLNENMLSGEIPSSLGNLSNLRQLSLSRNMLSGEIPSSLGTLSNLQQLSLSRNMLSGEIPSSLGNLSNLQQLSLSRNMLSGTIPTELGNLSSLQLLYLWGNRLTGEIPSSLGNLSNLQQLSLSQNQLTGTIPTELGNLSSLQLLYLSQNQLTGTIPTELGDLTQLRRLRLWGNELTGTIPTWLGDLTNLQQLYLNNNMLTGSTPATELGTLTDLEELGLWGNEELTWDTISNELGKRADRAVLRVLYDVNGGEEWTNNEKWFSPEEIPADRFSFSSWYGVNTDMDTGRVSGLNLGNNGLKEELTNAIEALDGLKDLNIPNNRQLTGELPLRLMDLPVETLDIRCTGVSAPADTDFQMWLRSGITFREACPPPSPPPPPPPVQPLEQVMGIRVIEGVEQLSVSWNPVSEADGYKVQWKSGSQQFDSSRQHIVTSGDTTSYTISNLVSGTEYTVRVIATKSDADDGTPSLEVTRATSPSAPEPPVQSPGNPQSSEGGGCAIASNAEARDNSQKVVFDLLLIISALIAVSWKSSSGTRRTQHSGLRNPSKISCEQEITPGVSLNSPARGRGKVFSSAFCRNEASRQFTTTQAGCGAGKQLVSQKET